MRMTCLLAPTIGSVAVRAQQQGNMVALALLHTKDNGGLGKKSILLSKVPRGIEAEGPSRGALDVGEDVNKGVDGDLPG